MSSFVFPLGITLAQERNQETGAAVGNLSQEESDQAEPLLDDLDFAAESDPNQFFSAAAPIRTFSATVADDRVCRTLATTLEEIPGTTVRFNIRSSITEEAVVTFVANWPRPSADEIPAGSKRVDPISNGGGVLVHEGTATSVSNGTHGFTFATERLPPGDHVAKIFFLDNVLGPVGQPNGTVCVDDRSTVVQHP
jgi:hypothetical protein